MGTRGPTPNQGKWAAVGPSSLMLWNVGNALGSSEGLESLGSSESLPSCAMSLIESSPRSEWSESDEECGAQRPEASTALGLACASGRGV